MNRVFVRDYNPAYDFFILRYFRDGGITVGDDLTNAEAREIAAELEKKPALTPQEKLFISYVQLWTSHPEARPSNYSLLERIPSNRGKLGIQRLAELESQLQPGQGKLLFSKDEAAKGIFSFYKRQLTDWLRTDIGNKAPASRLGRYLVDREIKLLPDARDVGRKRVEEAIRTTSVEVLAELDCASLDDVITDVGRVLAEHQGLPENHLRRTKSLSVSVSKGAAMCEHSSKYVTISVHRESKESPESMFLSPSRGRGAVQDYYWEVFFPRYLVLAKTGSRTSHD